ncbi:hypothetical protein FRB93_000049 [Tulasnella sp. JGI-2019a]|nr:hypothetical protein FRB93_000049 [Tulasnella sp. JGI-2019a]
MSGTGSDASSLELVTFDGSGDVTIFLQNVMRVALVQGRQRDDDWMVSYAEASLTGDALRWFVGLNEVSLRSWRSVRNAFLARFTAPAARVTVSKHPLPSEVSQNSVQGGNVYKTLVVGKSGGFVIESYHLKILTV